MIRSCVLIAILEPENVFVHKTSHDNLSTVSALSCTMRGIISFMIFNLPIRVRYLLLSSHKMLSFLALAYMH
jgi:hypothetical protein